MQKAWGATWFRTVLWLVIAWLTACDEEPVRPSVADALVPGAHAIKPIEEAPRRFTATIQDDNAADVIVPRGEALMIQVSNDYDEEVLLTVSSRVVSAAGEATTDEVISQLAHAREVIELAVPIDRLPLPATELDFMPAISLVVRGDYPDGTHANVAIPNLFAEPIEDAWRLRGREQIEARADGFALSTSARALQEQSPDLITAAYVTPISPDDPRLRNGLGAQAQARQVLPTREDARRALASVGMEHVLDSSQHTFGFVGADQERLEDVPTLASTEEGDIRLTRQAAIVSPVFCFVHNAVFEDAGFGEDLWTSPLSTVPLSGALVIITGPGGFVTSGFLTSAIFTGCIGLNNVQTGSYTAQVFTTGSVNGNSIEVLKSGTSVAVQSVTFHASSSAWIAVVVPTGTSFDELNAYAVLSAHTSVLAGTGATYDVHTNQTSTFYRWDLPGQPVWLAPQYVRSKFTLGHEIGHRVAHLKMNDFIAYDYSFTEAGVCSSTSHHVTSKEYQSGAFHEGFATFFTSHVFNDTAQDDGTVYIGGFDIDLRSPTPSPLVFAYMENTCSSPFAGFGNETDWARALWGVLTIGTGNPTMTRIHEWIAAPPPNPWTKTNTYTNLDSMANTLGGGLNAKWDSAKVTHGVDH